MINHARTLLLNVAGASSQRQYPGEEYIPSEFQPVVLPSYLLLLRRALFGTAPDRYFLNFRAQELLRYLHETELQEFVYRLDPRVTYWPPTAAPFFDPPSKISIQKTSGAGGGQLSVQGTPAALSSLGRSVREYSVAVAGGAATTALVNEPGTPITTPLIVTSGITQALPLPETPLTCKISNPQAGERWTIVAQARPAAALTTLLPVLELLGEPVFLGLFGAAPIEPYATFKNLWFDHLNPVYRIGGLTLAMIYRADELRKKNHAID